MNRTSRWTGKRSGKADSRGLMGGLLAAILAFGWFACRSAAPILVTILLRLGEVLISTTAGHTLEKTLDQVFFPSQKKDDEHAEVHGANNEKVGDITISLSDPKKG